MLYHPVDQFFHHLWHAGRGIIVGQEVGGAAGNVLHAVAVGFVTIVATSLSVKTVSELVQSEIFREMTTPLKILAM